MAIVIPRGDTRDFTINYLVNGVSGVATGYSFFFTAKSKLDESSTDANAVIKKNITGQASFASGYATFTLSNTDTSITPAIYYYNVRIENGSGTVVSSSNNDTLEITLGSTQRV